MRGLASLVPRATLSLLTAVLISAAATWRSVSSLLGEKLGLHMLISTTATASRDEASHDVVSREWVRMDSTSSLLVLSSSSPSALVGIVIRPFEFL